MTLANNSYSCTQMTGKKKNTLELSSLFRIRGNWHSSPKTYSYSIWTVVIVELLSVTNSFATPWIAAYQAPLSMGFYRLEYWSGLPFPTPDLPNPGIEPASPHWQVDSLPLSHVGSHNTWISAKYFLSNE